MNRFEALCQLATQRRRLENLCALRNNAEADRELQMVQIKISELTNTVSILQRIKQKASESSLFQGYPSVLDWIRRIERLDIPMPYGFDVFVENGHEAFRLDILWPAEEGDVLIVRRSKENLFDFTVQLRTHMEVFPIQTFHLPVFLRIASHLRLMPIAKNAHLCLAFFCFLFNELSETCCVSMNCMLSHPYLYGFDAPLEGPFQITHRIDLTRHLLVQSETLRALLQGFAYVPMFGVRLQPVEIHEPWEGREFQCRVVFPAPDSLFPQYGHTKLAAFVYRRRESQCPVQDLFGRTAVEVKNVQYQQDLLRQATEILLTVSVSEPFLLVYSADPFL